MEFMQPVEVSFKRRLRNITINVEFDEIGHMNLITDTINGLGAKISLRSRKFTTIDALLAHVEKSSGVLSVKQFEP